MVSTIGLLNRRPWSGQELAIDPREPLFNPTLHPIDFVPIGAANVGIRVDSLAHNSPPVEIARLRLLQFRSQLVDPFVNSRGRKFIGAELAPTINAALHEIRVLLQPAKP